MLTFLNSAILLGLAALTIPILIHLFTRQKTKVVYFSTLRFLKELQNRQIRRLKIRQILLLILRTLLILILVLAFARPTLKTTSSSSLESGAQLTAIIILDNTLSMAREADGLRLLDQARKRALEIVNLLRQGDEIYLLYPQDPPKFAHEGARYSLAAVRELIDDTELSYNKTDYVTALNMADQILNESANINKEVYLICDMQKAGLNLPEPGNGSSLLGKDVKLFVMPIPAANAENLAITKVAIGNQILETGKVVEIHARIKNYSRHAAKNKLIHIFVNGKRVGQNVVTLESQTSTDVVFRIVPERTGFQSGFVMLEDDDLNEDNRRYFSFNISDEIRLLLVGNHAADTQYLNLALRPGRTVASSIRVKEIEHRELSHEDLTKYQAIILSNVPRLDYTETLKIQRFIKSGGGLLVFLGADVDLRNYNDGFHKKLNLPLLTQSIQETGSEQFLSLGKIDFSHPIFRDVFEGEKFVESPHVRFAVNVSSQKPLDKIIEYSNGAPFLFESRFHEGHILYITTGISSDWSDFAFRGLFVPLVNRCARYLAGTTSFENDEIMVGQEITFAPENLGSAADLVMAKPDDTQIKIKPKVSKGNYFVRFGQTDVPGIYKLRSSDKVLAQWAVNADPIESESAAFEMDEIVQALNIAQAYEIKNVSEIAAVLQESRFGREFWKILIWIALGILLVEMLLFREKSVKSNAKTSQL